MGCNATQNEKGGKDLLLKVCKDITGVSSVDESATLTKTAHGLKVGDVLRPLTIGALTSLENEANSFYFVKEVLTADTFTVAATPGGAAIVMDGTEASLLLEAFKTLGGLRSKSFGFSSEEIDITSGDSDQWKMTLDGAGIRSFEVSGSGVYTSEENFQKAQQDAFDNKLQCFMFIDVKASQLWVGCFKVTSLEISGDYDGEGSYSISAASSGAITTFTAA